jgi:carbonic anhydrase/acetyltransferase-like protein (isoleucine patch superfamily)
MLIERNGRSPKIDDSATVAASATIVGNVTVGARACIDHNVLIASSGPPVELGEEVIVLAGSVVRSVGGGSRPAFAVRIGRRTLVSPLCALTGCEVGRSCYVATGAIVLQGAAIGEGARIGAGSIVHAGTRLPDEARVGMRHIAVPTDDGFLTTGDIEEARRVIAAAGFFGTTFDADEEADQTALHDEVISKLLEEVHGWRDVPVS